MIGRKLLEGPASGCAVKKEAIWFFVATDRLVKWLCQTIRNWIVELCAPSFVEPELRLRNLLCF